MRVHVRREQWDAYKDVPGYAAAAGRSLVRDAIAALDRDDVDRALIILDGIVTARVYARYGHKNGCGLTAPALREGT